MSIIIYTGLSLSFDDARKMLDAEYLPPVKRGDIYDLLEKRDDVEIIGIIDGLFHQSPAVAHKEILEALKRGITVVGGSSMGALRACELYPFGMIGVGKIFEDYKNGVIESDDDVAVSLNPENYEQMSESWINMKYNFEFALKDNIINQKQCEELLKISKELYYPKRSFEYVIKKSSLDDNKKLELLNYIKSIRYDIKNEDAKKVIEYIKNLISTE
ncbi:MAG TPA: TfuA-related McrA-glycine thioamidation protein [Methanosphaera sp.]|nr:TfuA-related McrA-glycine thioamidation protein [Methanosphaera sp.]HII08061.1 TfuA-related McrA-glycine thioamidation protein [Methanosphaera sp.]HIJ16110.1 TfuA-related McrA-glycine thioamidation protein [Methanosphaera sp.]